MKNMQLFLLLFICANAFVHCKKESIATTAPGQSSITAAQGKVAGIVKNAQNAVLKGAKITLEHTVWHDTYVLATSNIKGKYNIVIPSTPAGDWTAKAQFQKAAYGQKYLFDLDGDTAVIKQNETAVRNFTWKLSGKKPAGANSYYGAHVDLYPFGTDADMAKVKIVFTPVGDTLIDGSAATAFERKVEDVAGIYMVKDVPVGKYSITAKYTGKKLYLDNRHDDKEPAVKKTFVFGKYGYLGETEYNVEFWVIE